MTNSFLWLFGTVAVYILSLRLNTRFRSILTQPILVSAGIIMFLLVGRNIPYDEYAQSTTLLSLLVGPATVALAVPLYRNAWTIRRNLKAALLTVAAGAAAGLLAPLVINRLLGGPSELGWTMAPKSATTPIAMEIAKYLNGVPELTAVFTVLTGILGSLAGSQLVRALGVRDPGAIGLVVGISGHAIGTAEMMRQSPLQGAFSGFGMAVTGIVTVIFSLVFFC